MSPGHCSKNTSSRFVAFEYNNERVIDFSGNGAPGAFLLKDHSALSLVLASVTKHPIDDNPENWQDQGPKKSVWVDHVVHSPTKQK